ncbi:MAG: CHRD domain-containing protein, partial [Verrucomicrobia subdivision 3 bacterium]|nr:CHRD domain-containing protein [Limisphaerales bacterium]
EIYGTTIANLTGAGKFPDQPDQSLYQHIADWRQPQTGNPTRTQDEPWNQYGVRMSGYFIPRRDGSHRFYFTHDDEAQFRMSPDDNPANAAILVTPTGVRNIPYADFAPQFVDVAGLVAGQPYYFEALVKEGGGGDYLSVGVREPDNGLITNSITAIQPQFLAALADPNAAPALSITNPPANVTVEVGHSATFSVGVSFSGNNLPYYQWKVDGVAVAGANGPTFVTPPAVAGPDQAVTVDVHLPGVSVTSAAATLHVVPDTTAPQINASVVLSGTTLSLGFTEPVVVDFPASLTDPALYRVNDMAGIVQSVEIVTPSALKLNLNGSVSGTVTVRASTALEDAAGNAIAESGDLTGFSVAFTATAVTTWTDIANSAGPPTPAGTVFTVNNRDFVVTAGGADVWSGGDQFTYIYEQRTGDFDVKVRVDRLDLAVGAGNLWSKAGLNIRETLDGTGPNGSRMVWTYPTPTNGAGQFEAAIRPEPGRDVIDVNGGSYGRHGRGDGSAWVRVKRVGKSFTYYDSYDGRNWNRIGLPRVADANPENSIGGIGLAIADAGGFPETLYVGLGVVSHNQNIITTATLFDYGDWSYEGATVAVTRDPADTVGYVGSRVKFSVAGVVDRAPQHELIVQWQRNGVDIPGAVSTYVDNYTYTTPVLTLDDSGAQYRAKLIVSGATPVFSSAATLTMLATAPDGLEPEVAMTPAPPQLLMARRDPTDPNQIILTFDELLRPSSVNNGTYTIDQGVVVTQARRLGIRKVLLTATGLAPLSNCVTYAISVSGVQDGSGNEMMPTDTTIPADAAARVLFITGNASGMNRSDRIVIDRLDSFGYEVTPISATAANRRGASAASGYSLIYLSSPGGTAVGSTFRGLAIPTIICRRDLADDYGFVPANAQTGTIGAQTQINIVAEGHPLAAGFPNGNIALVDTAQVDNRTFNWYSNPAPNAVVIAREVVTTNNFRPVILAFEAGATTLNVPAASRRVATYLEDNVPQWFNNNARALFDAMINWVSIPSLIHPPQNQTLAYGSSGALCAVAGSLTNPSYQWYKDGMLIMGATGARLVFNNVVDADAGNYTVVISNASGSVTSSVATVTVPLPELDIARTGDDIVLSWTGGGTLQEAKDIRGPWRNAANQANPQNINQPTFAVFMNGAQEPPPTGGGTGTGSGIISLAGNTLTIKISFSGLSGNVNNCHIHGVGGRGTNAGVLYGLNAFTTQGGTSGTIDGSVTLTNKTGLTIEEQLDQLRGGLWYVNIHTTTFGGGEIRGQIDPVLFCVSADPQQDGGEGRTGLGLGVVALNDNVVTINVSFSGLSGNVNNCHIHGPAPRGTDAGVLYGLNAITTQGAMSGTVNGSVTLVDGTGGISLADQLSQLEDGLWYINIHTTTFGGGEIRGQIEKPLKQFFRVVRP